MSALALSLKLSAIKTLSAVQRAINILKSAGPGAWYDPSDLTTLFQDSAGTTPVTAVEQPVGLMLDKSQGLVLGAELFTGAYTVGASVTATFAGNEATATFVGGALTSTGANWLSVTTADVPLGTFCVVEFDAQWVSGSDLQVGAGYTVGRTISAAGNGGVKRRYTATTTAGHADVKPCTFGSVDSGAVWKITVISTRVMSGNHLIQPTATSRPTLSSRYNLLTKTEDFSHSDWITGKTAGASVTANTTTAPDGTLTADTVTFAAPGDYLVRAISGWPAVTGQSVVMSYYSQITAGLINFGGASLAGTDAHSFVDVGGGWYRHTTIRTFTTTATGLLQIVPFCAAAGAGSYVLWGASLVPASDAALPYQRVNTATDYDFDFSKFPPFLRMDGIDDSMYSAASVDFTTTDKMTVFAGVHKASDAGVGVVAEFSADININTGAFSTYLPLIGSNFGAGSKGTIQSWGTVNTPAGPSSSVLSVALSSSGAALENMVAVRRNAAAEFVSVGVSSSSTGNYGNYPLYVGRRNNASLPFNGRIYQLAIKGKALSADEIATLESYINSKTKAF